MKGGLNKDHIMENEELSTYDRLMRDPKRRQKFEDEYQKLVLVEILIPILTKSEVPVRLLAKAAGVSPTTIQDIKSGKKEGISYATFVAILEALDYKASIRVHKFRQNKLHRTVRKRKTHRINTKTSFRRKKSLNN